MKQNRALLSVRVCARRLVHNPPLAFKTRWQFSLSSCLCACVPTPASPATPVSLTSPATPATPATPAWCVSLHHRLIACVVCIPGTQSPRCPSSRYRRAPGDSSARSTPSTTSVSRACCTALFIFSGSVTSCSTARACTNYGVLSSAGACGVLKSVSWQPADSACRPCRFPEERGAPSSLLLSCSPVEQGAQLGNRLCSCFVMRTHANALLVESARE